MKRFGIIVVAALLGPSSNVAAKCTASTAIWAHEKDGKRQVVYGTDGIEYGSTVYIEEWRGNKLAWRVSGQATCSNGAVVCSVDVKNASGNLGQEGYTDAIIERIDENGDRLPEWVVFAGLGQSLYHSGGPDVEWFNRFGPEEPETLVVSNVFKFMGCRKTEDLELNPPKGRKGQQTVGIVYATPDVCENYQAKGVLMPPEGQKVFNDGIWWMDDKQLMGWELSCQIAKLNEGMANVRCTFESEDEAPTEHKYPFKQIGLSRQFGEQLLVQCPAKQ